MNKTYNSIRLFLFTCSGEDNFILKRCKSKIQKRFALLGFFVLLIFVGCFFSATFFTYSLFDGGAKLLSIPMGIIWGTIVVNMYLLLLHTISPAIIPLSSKKKKRKINELEQPKVQNTFLNLSMLLRMSFMVFLAIIIAQPLNVVLLSSTVETSIEKHKIKERVRLYSFTNSELIKRELLDQKEFVNKIKNRINSEEAPILLNRIQTINDKIYKDSLFIVNTSKQLKQLTLIEEKSFLIPEELAKKEKILENLDSLLNNEVQSDNDFITSIDSISINGSLEDAFYKFKTNLIALVTEKINNYTVLNELLNKSNFYIKTIQLLLAENPVSWIVTLLVCLVFLLPIYYKYKVRNLSATIFKTEEQNEPEIIRLREELINTNNFNWLEKKIKSTNIKNIRTSDYYFQRMLIEHKIILEEYDIAKKKFSQTLTTNVIQYNGDSLKRLLPLLEKLKQVNLAKYNEISKQIFEEYVEEEMIKYEYWLDCPFRTKKNLIPSIINNEIGLLDFVYNYSEEAEKQ
jgi:hypothetical protein